MKRLILILFAICNAILANSQTQFGFKAGLNIANFSTSGITYLSGTSSSSRISFNGGVFGSLQLHTNFLVQLEIIYSGQGQKLNNLTVNQTINYDYLNLPILFKYKNKSGLFAFSGPQIGVLLSAKNMSNGHTFDTKSESQSTDFCWAFGIGYNLQTIPVGIDLRYNLGLTNIYKDNNFGNGKNSVFQIDIFYHLKIK